jgi:hypothetical protein
MEVIVTRGTVDRFTIKATELHYTDTKVAKTRPPKPNTSARDN